MILRHRLCLEIYLDGGFFDRERHRPHNEDVLAVSDPDQIAVALVQIRKPIITEGIGPDPFHIVGIEAEKGDLGTADAPPREIRNASHYIRTRWFAREFLIRFRKVFDDNFVNGADLDERRRILLN